MADTLTVAVFHETTGWSLPDPLLDRIRACAEPTFEVREAPTRADLTEILPETDALIGLPITDEQLAPHAARLRWIQLTHSIGDATPAVTAAIRAGARVTSAAPARAPQVAEHAMALTLALTRRIDAAVRAQGEHRWMNEQLAGQVRSLHGAAVGLVGSGHVGEEIARRARAFGARVLVSGPGQPPEDELLADDRFDLEHINDMIMQSDVVIVATPRLPSTIDLIGKKQLGAFKPSAILVDVSRAGVVRQDALIEALRRGRLAGAALDVFRTEPLPETSSLWTMPNVILTPHVSAATPRYWEQACNLFCTNVERLVAGKALIAELEPAHFQAHAHTRS